MHLAVAAIARPTFDMGLAAEVACEAFDVLRTVDPDLIGTSDLLTDDESVARAAGAWKGEKIDALVILQATFTDSTPTAAMSLTTDAPLILWAIPEARTGGRLRLNSLCGINLSAYVLRRRRRDYRWIYRRPSDPLATSDLEEALRGAPAARPAPVMVDGTPATRPAPVVIGVEDDSAIRRASDVRKRLAATTIGVIGDHPRGFEPCAYDPTEMAITTGVGATAVALPRLFERAAAADASKVESLRAKASSDLAGISELDQAAVDQSLRLHLGMREIVDDLDLGAIATRCWPECFTEFGAAACTAHSILGDSGVPACCEADAYGAITGLILQWLGESCSFIADLVHLDRSDNTAVFWHCGLAPISLADPESVPTAALHSNRQLPLLNEFPLKPGRVTLARLSQSAGQPRLVVGGAEMLRQPLPFSGTAGVARLDTPVDDALATVMAEGLEHHYGIVYGDVRPELRSLADQLGIGVVEL